MTGQMQFLNWEDWRGTQNTKLPREELIYLRDHRRVKGAGIRVFQYLVNASWGQRPVVYDFFAQHSIIHAMLEMKPVAVTLIRCKQKKELEPPDFIYHHMDFPVDEFLKILQDLQEISLPHPLKHLMDAMGHDGADYEFAYNVPRDGLLIPVVTYLRYHWWGNEQPELKALAEYWEALRRKLDKLLDTPPSIP
jgi:hypothetical protein